MTLQTSYGQTRLRGSPGLSKAAPKVTQLNPPSQHLPCAFTQALSFIMHSIQLIYLICNRNLSFDKKNPAKSATVKKYVYSQMRINSPSVKATLSKQVLSQPGPLKTILRQTSAGGCERWTFQLHFIGWICHFNASDKAMLYRVHEQHPVPGTYRQSSKAP